MQLSDKHTNFFPYLRMRFIADAHHERQPLQPVRFSSIVV